MAADKIRITQAVSEENLAEVGRGHSEKLQVLGRALVSGVYMLIRSVKMYDPDNAVFNKPLGALQEVINQIIARDGQLVLVGVKDAFYLNNMLVKVELNALESTRFLLQELRAKDVGGIALDKPITSGDLKNFIWIFGKDQNQSASEDGVGARKLVGMKVTRYSKLKEKLQGADDGAQPGQVDRKKYALTVYARGIFFVQKTLEAVRAGRPISTGKALRIVQELVDLAYGEKTHFLGMTSTRSEDEYLVYHQVNTCLLAIVFGVELGLTKPQLRDLGYAALFHELGMATMPPELAGKKGALTPEERAQVERAPLQSVRNLLLERGFGRSTVLRAVSTFEAKKEFGTPVRNEQGEITAVTASGQLGVYARILAICSTYDALTSKRPFRDAYGPEIALLLMWTELRHRFDPELLTVFMRVMAIAPMRVLSGEQTLTLGS